MKPDAIRYGLVKKAGWTQHYKNETATLTIPAMTLGDLVKHLKTSLGIQKLRVVGDLNQSCSKLAIMPGAAGGQRQVERRSRLAVQTAGQFGLEQPAVDPGRGRTLQHPRAKVDAND